MTRQITLWSEEGARAVEFTGSKITRASKSIEFMIGWDDIQLAVFAYMADWTVVSVPRL